MNYFLFIRTKVLYIATLTFFSLSINNNLNAQVTIGTEQEPVEGALLQLKNNTSAIGGDPNATKGLGMPRVALKERKNLFPMFTDDGSNGYIEGTKADLDKSHTGLVVYNVTNKRSDGLCPDMYVWDGEEWQPLLSQQEEKPDIKVKDVDGNEYTARWFGDVDCESGSKGAYWFLSNLMVTRLPDGSPLPAEPVEGVKLCIVR